MQAPGGTPLPGSVVQSFLGDGRQLVQVQDPHMISLHVQQVAVL